jgi:hypothetical protein
MKPINLSEKSLSKGYSAQRNENHKSKFINHGLILKTIFDNLIKYTLKKLIESKTQAICIRKRSKTIERAPCGYKKGKTAPVAIELNCEELEMEMMFSL